MIPSSNPYAQYTAETTSTPATTVMTVSLGATSVILYIGDFDTTERGTPLCDLYVTINSTTHVIKDVARWSTHSLRAEEGDTVKVGARNIGNTAGVAVTFGITDGAYIDSTADPTGTTGDAFLDYSSPAHWEPTEAHLVLTDPNTTIKFNDKAGFFRFLISESENGSSNWTKPVAVMMRSGEAFRYRARFRYIALMAMEVSQTINVTLAGTISDSSTYNEFSVDETFTPYLSGNTRLVSSSLNGFGSDAGTPGQNLEYAIDNASSGDVIIVIDTAVYVLSRILGHTAGGAKYSKHLYIQGGGATLQDYGMISPPDTYIWIVRDFICDYAAVNTANTPAGGLVGIDSGTLWLFECTIAGPGTGTAKNIIGATNTGQLYAFGCTISAGAEDIINTSESTSFAQTNCCNIHTAGHTVTTGNENLFTAHNGSVMVDYGSTFTRNRPGEAGPAIIHADDSFIYLFFSKCLKGTAAAFELGASSKAVRLVHGVYVDELATNSVITHMVGCEITMTAGGIALKPDVDGQTFVGNRFHGATATSGNQIFEPRASIIIRGNLFDNVRTPISPNSSGTYTLAGRTWYVEHNTFQANCNSALVTQAQSVGTLYFRNNICENNTFDISVPGTTTGTIVSDGNIFGFVVDTDYTALAGGSLGANDTNNTTPSIHATTKRPSLSDTDGTYNCDNEGSTTVSGFGYLGADLCGLSNKSDERPRGCYGAYSRKLSLTTYHARRWAA